MAVKIAYTPECLKHYNPYEPKERAVSITDYLEKEAKGEYELVPPSEVHEEDLLLVHSKRMIEDLKFRSETGMGLSENPFQPETFHLAKLACGCALKAARVADTEGFSFAITRPPGHHAGKSFCHGFCYMNNLAFALRKNQKGRKALIVDFDVHHGNGTQDIFYDDKSVFFFSLHQSPLTLFPFRTGFKEENSAHVENIPLEPGAGDKEFLGAIGQGLGTALSKFKPDFIAVSAGFDSYKPDRIASVNVEHSETYHKAGKLIAELGLPTFAVLEGGYFLPDLGKNVWNFISAFKPR